MIKHRLSDVIGRARRDGDPDLILVAGIRNGDRRPFDHLYHKYQPRLMRFIGNLVRSSATVEEVVNDSLMVMWERPHSFGGMSKFSTWLFAIAYRKALRAREQRDRPLDEHVLLLEPDCLPDAMLGRERTRAVLLEAIEELSPDHRAVIDLTYFQEFGYREIAEIMGCPVATVKTRMFHARRHLRSKLTGGLSDWI